MSTIMSEELREKLEKVKKREWWPITSLAKVLGRPRKYVYRRVNNKNFSVLEDGTFKKVLSNSVVEFYEKRVNPTSSEIIQQKAFKKGFYAGLKVYETSEELDIPLDELEELIAEFCEGGTDVSNYK